jgi:hypothetical protein
MRTTGQEHKEVTVKTTALAMQASITVLPAITAAPACFSAFSAASPATASTTTSPNPAASANGFYSRAVVLRGPVLELGGLAGADLDLMTVLEESGAQRLSDHARPDNADFHAGPPCLGPGR